jgi:hypothetical protein
MITEECTRINKVFGIWIVERPLNTEIICTQCKNILFVAHIKQNTDNQYSESNVMHFVFNLLRIKGLYMFRALLGHPQEVLHKQHLVYCVRVK